MISAEIYDLIIIGGGPAGLSAALYAARDKHKVLVIEKKEVGGQIALTDVVSNYPGVPDVNGRELAQIIRKQAESFGAQIAFDTVTSLDLDTDIKTVTTATTTYQTISVILATGAKPRSAGFAGEEKYKGRGVAYCATCDGALYTGCDIYVIGGGLSAVQEAKFLSKYAHKVIMIVREASFTCGEQYIEELQQYPNIFVKFETTLTAVHGKSYVDSVDLVHLPTGEKKTMKSEDGMPLGVFVFVGQEPDTSWLPDNIAKDSHGYLITDSQGQTNIPGVCAAGDLCVTPLRQAITAAADGAIAATALREYIKTKRNANIVLTEKPILRLWLDDTAFSQEIETFLKEADALKDLLILRTEHPETSDSILPYIEICRPDGTSTGIYYHTVPKGLEWDTFLLALFTVSGDNVQIDPDDLQRIHSIDKDLNIKILTTLTCSNCPATVMSANQIAAINPYVTAEIFDITHFPKMRFKYQVNTVPAILINDRFAATGKTDLDGMLKLIARYMN